MSATEPSSSVEPVETTGPLVEPVETTGPLVEPVETTGPLVEPVETTYTLDRYPEQLAVVRLGPGAEVPSWAESSSVFSITATATETSLVCAKRSVPAKARQQGPFTAFAVRGPLDFALVGVLASLLAPLAEAGISVFTLSTFDTDWILVGRDEADAAVGAWADAGHTVEIAVPEEQQEGRR